MTTLTSQTTNYAAAEEQVFMEEVEGLGEAAKEEEGELLPSGQGRSRARGQGARNAHVAAVVPRAWEDIDDAPLNSRLPSIQLANLAVICLKISNQSMKSI